MVLHALDRAFGAGRMPPVGAGNEGPPSRRIVERDKSVGFLEQQRSGLDALEIGAGVQLGIGRQFGKGAIAGRGDEFGESGVGYRRLVDPEAVDLDAAQRPFFGVEAVRPHGEGAALDETHTVERRGGGGGGTARCGFHGRAIISILGFGLFV